MTSPKKPNIILITFDDCRADHMGYLGYKKNLTPFLDSVAKEGVSFSNAFSTGSGSPQSFVATLTSTYPADHGGFAKIGPPRKVISEVLQEHGYATIATHSAAYLSSYFGYDRGWDVFNYVTHAASAGGGGVAAGHRHDTDKAKMLRRMISIQAWFTARAPWLGSVFAACKKVVLFFRKLFKDFVHPRAPFYTGEEMNEEAKKMLTAHHDDGRPLFLWVHYMDVHEPLAYFWTKGRGLRKKIKYHLADSLLFLFGGSSKINRFFKSLYLELYDSSIKYVDSCAKDLVDYLRAQKVFNDGDLMLFSADHGEEFFEKGMFGHEQRPYRANLNVPLLLWSPDNLQPRREDRPVSLIDLPPTILDFAGVPKPSVYRGTSLFDVTPREVVSQAIDCAGDLTNQVFIGATIIDGGYKFIDFHHQEMLFSIEDKKEERDILEVHGSIAISLREKLKKYIPASYSHS